MERLPPLRQFIIKAAARCNLNCSYCYVYHKGDGTWRQRPSVMAPEVFAATVRRIAGHCRASGQRTVRISFHGGEPTLIGARTFDEWCEQLRDALRGLDRVEIGLQTNGTLLDAGWADILKRHDVDVGISIDATPEIHDRFRVDHAGRGSYHSVVRGIDLMCRADLRCSLLTVIPLGADPLTVHRHLASLGSSTVTYLLPDHTYDELAGLKKRYGSATPVADFLIPIFDEWWRSGGGGIRIRNLWNMGRLVMGGASRSEEFGNRATLYAFVDTDGSIQGLDVLRICEPGMHETGLRVQDHEFATLMNADSVAARCIVAPPPICAACRRCPESQTCAGGYLPHRYSRHNGFDNPSVWCADILRLFAHIRTRLGVSVEETESRRQALTTLGSP